MNKREYCESRESVAYYSGLNGRFPCVSFAGCIGYNPAIMALWSYTRQISLLFMPYWGGIMF